MSKLKAALAVLILVLLVCPPAFAQESSSAAKEPEPAAKATESGNPGANNWEFSLGPMYVWLIAHKADLTVKGDDVDPDVSYSNVFDDTNGGLVFEFEAVRKQSWGFLQASTILN